MKKRKSLRLSPSQVSYIQTEATALGLSTSALIELKLMCFLEDNFSIPDSVQEDNKYLTVTIDESVLTRLEKRAKKAALAQAELIKEVLLYEPGYKKGKFYRDLFFRRTERLKAKLDSDEKSTKEVAPEPSPIEPSSLEKLLTKEDK